MNQKHTDVAPYQHALPGMAPRADAATELLRGFTVWDEGRDSVSTRLPTAGERGVLVARGESLDRSMRAFWNDPADKRLVRDALVVFFNGYPSLLNADAPAMVTAYMADLKSLPAWAVVQALDDVKHGREFALDPDWPPSSPRVYDVATKLMRAPVEELSKIRKLLAAKPVRAELPPEERDKIGARIREMADAAKRQLSVPDAAILALRREADERRERERRRLEEQLAAEFLDEYASLGVEPVRVGGVMISPELAAKVNPAAFARKSKP